MSEITLPTQTESVAELDMVRQEVGAFALKCFERHAPYLQISQGTACLLAARVRKGATEVHGFVADLATGSLAVESHFINREDKEYGILFSHDIAGTNPDGGCDHLAAGVTGVEYTQLSSGRAWPTIQPQVGMYRLLRHRLSMLHPTHQKKHAYLTQPDKVLPLVSDLILDHQHRLYHPALRHLVGYKD